MLPHLSWSYRQAKEGVKRWSFSPSWKVAESFTDLPLLKMTFCNSLKTNFLGAMCLCRFSVNLYSDRREQGSSCSFYGYHGFLDRDWHSMVPSSTPYTSECISKCVTGLRNLSRFVLHKTLFLLLEAWVSGGTLERRTNEQWISLESCQECMHPWTGVDVASASLKDSHLSIVPTGERGKLWCSVVGPWESN